MLIRQLLLIAAGASYGLLSAAGVFTVLVAVGLIPRFAGKTHTARYVLLYEEMVIFGTLAGCFITVFPKYSQWGSFLREQFPEKMRLWMATGVAAQAVFGLFPGCLSDAWRWLSRRCWTVFPFLPEEFRSGMVWDGRSWVWRRGKSVGLCSILPQNCTGPYNKPGASVRGSGSPYYRKVCTRRAENERWTKKGGRV